MLINLTTGTYTVEPVLDPKKTASPVSTTGDVVVGANVSVGTFTVVGVMGTVNGNVSFTGQPIQTGVLIIVSIGAVSMPPPILSSAALASAAYPGDNAKPIDNPLGLSGLSVSTFG